MENQSNDLKTDSKEKREGVQITKSPTIFLNSHIRKIKDTALKIRLQTLIKARGLSEKDFYKGLGYSPQVWYALSWGIWEANIETKVKVAKALQVDSSVIWNIPINIQSADKIQLEKRQSETNLPSSYQSGEAK